MPSGRVASIAIILAMFVTAGPASVAGQQIESGGLGGWQFGGSLETDAGKLSLGPAAGWGGYFDFWVRPGGLGEFTYQRQATRASIDAPLEPADSLLDLTIHYLHLGGLYEPAGGTARPFGGATAGVTVLDPHGTGRSAVTRFSMSFVGGGKLYLARWLGLRAEARIFLTSFADQTELFCRLPGGCYISTTGQLLTQLHGAASAFLRF